MKLATRSNRGQREGWHGVGLWDEEKTCCRNQVHEGLAHRQCGLLEELEGGLVWPESQ